MTKLLTNIELVSILEKHIPTCNKLNFISAYVTMPAVRWLEHLTAGISPALTIVGRFSPHDFISGASDFDCLKACLNGGFSVKALSNLHAKIYQIDDLKIYTGSANLTGKGLGLISNYNIEAASEVEPTEENLKFIENVVNNATTIDFETLKKMEEHLSSLSVEKIEDLPTEWPEEILEKSSKLFVTDFPLSGVSEQTPEYAINPSLPFAIIEMQQLSEKEKGILFKKTKVYKWVFELLKFHEKPIRFGELTALIHEELADDPEPYRKEVKLLQANLYRYIKQYASDDIEIYVPGRRSECLRLK